MQETVSRSPVQPDVDPILVAVIQKRLRSITEQMALTLLRTTRSPVLNEARDFATGLYSPAGKMWEQTEYAPLLAFPLPPACEYVASYFEGDLAPGDVIIHNDVYRNGNQLQDVSVLRPIFHDGTLLAWAACKAHVADMGGGVPGSINPGAREIWHEGLRIPPVKLYEGGKRRRDVWDLIFSNVRFKTVEEDVQAQIGSCAVGERELLKLVDQYGQKRFLDHMASLLDRTEQMMRAEIRAMPDGNYVGEDYLFCDGLRPDARIKLRVAITVRGDELFFDYTGTDPQTDGFVNAPLAATLSILIMQVLMHVDPDMPHNDGILRPLRWNIPEGTVLNTRFPAANGYGNFVTCVHSAALQKAFAQIRPDRVTAGWDRLLEGIITGVDPRKHDHYHDFFFISAKGGSGGTYGADGYDYIGHIGTAGGMRAQDPEMYEVQEPHFIVRNEYWPDSAGAGRWRGGLGVFSEIRLEGERMAGVVFGDGDQPGSEAFGLFGGKPGCLNRIELVGSDGSTYVPMAKEVLPEIKPQTLWRHWAAGGGGYGDPFQRPVAAVLEDVRNEVVSIQAAAEDYGVVIDPETIEVDEEATKARPGRT